MKSEDMKGEDMNNEDIENEDIENEDIENEDIENGDIKKKERVPTNRKVSAIMIITGAALLLVACGLFTYNRVFDYRAGIRAQELLDQVLAEAGWDLPPIEEMVYTPRPQVAAEPNEPDEPKSSPPPLDVSTGGERPPLDVESGTYGGSYISYGNTASGSGASAAPTYTTLGILTIPKLNVRLPVIAEYTDANLKVSCCKISGRADNKPYRLVISGHNIWSHFKGLDTLQIGDQIAFTDRDGITYYYGATEFLDLYKTNGAAVLEAVGWDITLITCKTDNTWRTVVRFSEITE